MLLSAISWTLQYILKYVVDTTTETRYRHSHVWRYLLCARCLAGELLREGKVAGTTPESNKASERGPHPHTSPPKL